MGNYIIEIVEPEPSNNLIEIETMSLDAIRDSITNDYTIEITEPSNNLIEIETMFLDTVTDNLTIERYDAFNLEIVNTAKILLSDLPDNIPMSKISGNLNYTRIDGLGNYISSFIIENSLIHVDDLLWGVSNTGLSGYLDQYQFDCGTP